MIFQKRPVHSAFYALFSGKVLIFSVEFIVASLNIPYLIHGTLSYAGVWHRMNILM